MSWLSFNRKGQISNYLIIVIFLFGFGIISLLAAVLMDGMIDGFTAAGVYSDELEYSGDKFFDAVLLHDYIILLVAIALIIGVGITSFKLNTAPVFFVVTLVMAVFLGFVSYFFNYIFASLVSEPIFAGFLTFFPRTLILCTNFHWISLLAVIVGSITLYAKGRGDEGVRGDTF